MATADPDAPGRHARVIEQLVEDNVNLAYWAAGRTRRCAHESYDDISSDALVGLWDAARRYDPDRGRFASFAMPRIFGAIADGRRQRDPLTRGQRDAGIAPAVSLETFLAATDAITIEGTLGDPTDHFAEVDDADELSARRIWLYAELEQMPTRQRFVVEALLAGVTLAEIGAEIGVTESRACQIKSEVTARLARRASAAA